MRLYLPLVLIVILGAVLRLAWLTSYPAGFTPDEASLGYNSYSILQTGNDEWGTPWWQLPFTNLRSFGDYKPPLYPFLALPSIKFIGLTEMATRLPNAIFGILAIVVIYFLAEELFPGSGLIAAFFLALSPWHISMSRMALEANLITLFLPLGILFFLKKSYLLSALTFAIGLYSYHSARLVIPLAVLILYFTLKPKLSKNLLLGLAAFILLSLPAAISYLGAGNARVSDVSILSPTDNWAGVADRRFAARAKGLPDTISRIFSNKPISLMSSLTKSYISYISPEFLFTSGAGEATYGMIPGRGVLYYTQLPLLLLFFILLLRKPNKYLILLFILFLISPLPATVAKGMGEAANRAAPMLPFLTIMSAIGLLQIRKYWPLVIGLTLVLGIFFLEDYIYHAPNQNAQAMSYGWSETLQRVAPMFPRFADVRFSRTLSEPQEFVAFYLKIPPQDYQQASKSWSKAMKFTDQNDGYFLNNFEFGQFHPQEKPAHPILYIGSPSDYPDNFPEYFHVDYPSGKTAIKVSQSTP